jgi:hypothetical protein
VTREPLMVRCRQCGEALFEVVNGSPVICGQVLLSLTITCRCGAVRHFHRGGRPNKDDKGRGEEDNGTDRRGERKGHATDLR